MSENNVSENNVSKNNGLENTAEYQTGAPTTKPNILLQLVKGFLYFCLFLFSQYVITFILMMYYGAAKVAEDAANDVPFDTAALTDYMETRLYENINLLFILYVSLFVIILILFFAIRKKSFWKETRMVAFPVKYIPGILVLSAGLFFFINSVLNLMPQSWLADYSESSSFIAEGSLLLSLFTKGLLAPISEELTFRGLMLSRFNKAMPKWLGILISSVVFGLIHGQALWFCYALLIGVVFCLVAIRTGSILSSMMLHILFNIGGVLLSYTDIPITLPLLVTALILGAALTGIGLFLIYRKDDTLGQASQASLF